MPIVSYLHQLFNAEQCQVYIHTLRWKDRPLQCPRCQSHHIGQWGMYHHRPGGKRSWCHGCQRTCNDLTATLLHRSQQTASVLDSGDVSALSRLFVPAHCAGGGGPCPDELPLVLVAAQRCTVV